MYKCIYIQLMQSRGRARTKNGRLIVILNSKCKEQIKKLEAQEGTYLCIDIS
jgi:queuine/archaeosine tRNA-ribosyltransferase